MPPRAGLAGTVTLLASAIGGVGLAAISPTIIGRVRTLQITIIWFSVFLAGLRGRAEISNSF